MCRELHFLKTFMQEHKTVKFHDEMRDLNIVHLISEHQSGDMAPHWIVTLQLTF